MRRFSSKQMLFILFISIGLISLGATWIMAQEDETPLAAGDIYTVQQGDVLDLIAAEWDVQTGCLAVANELAAPYHLEIGQAIRIDFTCPRYDGFAFVVNSREDEDLGQGGGATGGANTYRVERGDVLDLVAAEFDVQTGCLATANELSAPYRLDIGQILNIDLSCPPYSGDAFVPDPREDASAGQGGGDADQGGGSATGGANTYRVERGDVLDLVAAQFDVQTGCLATANELSAPYRLDIGQVLNIDLSCPPYSGDAFVPNPREDAGQGGGGAATGGANTYRVERGDVLDLVAAQFDVQTGCLATANELSAPYRLDIGQVLNIDLSCPPYSGDAFVANPREDASAGQGGGDADQGGGSATGGANTYRVERGDVLDLIAADFDVSTGCLAAANELEAPFRLSIGQTLNIDLSCPRYVGEAPVLNPRSDEDLGQGGGGGTSGSTYFVQRGDVLDLIALEYNVELGCLAAANGLDAPFRLDIGQQLAIDRSCPPYTGGSTPPLNEQSSGEG